MQLPQKLHTTVLLWTSLKFKFEAEALRNGKKISITMGLKDGRSSLFLFISPTEVTASSTDFKKKKKNVKKLLFNSL